MAAEAGPRGLRYNATMMVRSFAQLAAALTVVCALGAAPVAAGGHGHDNGVSQGGQAADMSPEQAAAIVLRAYGGRVVSVKPAGGGYSVRVLLDGGRVKTVQVDGNGGLRESNG